MAARAVSKNLPMSNSCVSFPRRLSALLTLLAFIFTTLAPAHGASLYRYYGREVRLVARDAFGGQIADTISLSVEGGMKVGLFTVAFQELQVPLTGIPLSVTRIYDSREQFTTVTTLLVDELSPTGYAQVIEEKTNGVLTKVWHYGHALIIFKNVDELVLKRAPQSGARTLCRRLADVRRRRDDGRDGFREPCDSAGATCAICLRDACALALVSASP